MEGSVGLIAAELHVRTGFGTLDEAAGIAQHLAGVRALNMGVTEMDHADRALARITEIGTLLRDRDVGATITPAAPRSIA